jgi:hypothetical protein
MPDKHPFFICFIIRAGIHKQVIFFFKYVHYDFSQSLPLKKCTTLRMIKMNRITSKIILYLIGISIGSFLLATYVEAAKTSDFLINQQERIEEDPHRLVLATAIANGHGDYDAFVFKEPLLNLQITDDAIQMDIDFYRLVYVKDNMYTFNLAMLITNLSIEPNGGLLIDGYHQIKVEIIFNQSVMVNNAIQNEFIETPITLYKDEDKLAIFEVNSLIRDNPSLLINSMQIGYVNMNNSIQYVYQFTEPQLSAIQLNQVILNELPINVLSSDDVIYDASLLTNLRQLNSYYVSHFSVYIGLVLITGYLIFLKPKKSKQ